MTTLSTKPSDKELEIIKPVSNEQSKILTEHALEFLHLMIEEFSAQIDQLLEDRKSVQKSIDLGHLPTFPDETREIRDDNWTVAKLPHDLLDRRVEITGPVDRKMIINALNSGANVFMADFEDSNSPTWNNIIQGQVNLYDAVRRTIEFIKNDGSKKYSLNEQTSVLMVRPRGLHLKEKGILYKNEPVYGSIVDFALFFFHNAQELIKRGSGPYFYIPKLQDYKEARLWNQIFRFAQDYLDIPHGTIKATVLLEHILAAFQMDEILFELKEHSAGLNSGRWDYIFSFIKTFNKNTKFVLPDRSLISMNKHFLQSYVTKLIKTCHRRKIHAMGGMAAQIPIKDDAEQNQLALNKVKQDKIREVNAGHDGTWVAHPGLIGIAKTVFDEGMKKKNQIEVLPEENITEEDLLKVPTGEITEAGIRININVGMKYLASWLCGNGCVPINHLMEDAATAEISRSQLWQWVNHNAKLSTGQIINKDLFLKLLNEEAESIKQEIGIEDYELKKFNLAKEIFKDLTMRDEIPEFLTVEAYKHLN